MHLYERNVNTSFRTFVNLFADTMDGPRRGDVLTRRPSRQGDVIMVDEPVTITYSHPRERVLFNAARDANPFLHLYHALWMLAGRNDVASVAYYAAKMQEFSDDGVTLNGAYGYRWRYHFGYDQIDNIVEQLRTDPNSRRAELQMWDPRIDGRGNGKDYPCNKSVDVTVRDGKLEITVNNRSNDMVWGMLGEDFVTFSTLQEYMAARLNVGVGKYHHFTNNLHVYDWNWKPEEWLTEYKVNTNRMSRGEIYCGTVPLVKDPAAFDEEVKLFVETYSGEDPNRRTRTHYDEPFLETVAQPMCWAWSAHKQGNYEMALNHLRDVTAGDWRVAATQWMTRRKDRREGKGVVA